MRSEQPVIFWTLIFAVALAPLPLASTYPWSWNLLAAVVGALVAMWSLRVVLGLQQTAFGLRATWPFIGLFAIVAGWAAAQTVSFTPRAWHHPLWDSTSRALEMELGGAISLNPDETFAALTRLLANAGIFWLALQYGRRKMRAEQILHAIIAAGAVYGLWGFVEHWFGWRSRLGLPGPGDVSAFWEGASGGHVYAAYVGIALICASALVLAGGAPTPRRFSFAELARRLIDGSGPGWPLMFAWLLLLAMVPGFSSRADVVSLGLALAALVVVATIGRTARWPRLIVFTLVTGLAIAAFAYFEPTAEEDPAGQGGGTGAGGELQTLALDAIGDAPWIGTGLGTFADLSRFYRTSDFTHGPQAAHNTYLELVVELGIPAASVLFVLFALLTALTFAGAARRQRDSAFAAAGFAATILVATHASLNYSPQVPAVAATYWLLLGAACAQSWSSRRTNDNW